MSSGRRILALAVLAALSSGATGAERLGDPTRPALRPGPASRKTESPHALRLESVWLSRDHRFAVINGRRVKPGDRAFGAQVVEIGLSGVRLRSSEGERWLTLSPTGFKRAARSKGQPR